MSAQEEVAGLSLGARQALEGVVLASKTRLTGEIAQLELQHRVLKSEALTPVVVALRDALRDLRELQLALLLAEMEEA